MKKIISTLLIAAVSLSVTACGGSTTASSQSGQDNSSNDGSTATAQPAAPQELQGEIAGEITVSAYESVTYKSYLEEAAAAFEAKYPGTKVNVSTFSAMPEIKTSESGGKKVQLITMEEDNQAEQDYIKKINTELMSGTGADILAIDVIPYYKYAESGQLEDLSKFMEADPNFNKSDYRENILEAMKYKGGQYIFPMDYSFEYFAYDSSLFSEDEKKLLQQATLLTYEQLIDAGQGPFAAANAGNPENPIQMFGSNPQTLFNRLFQASYSQFVDAETKTANFDSGEFTNLLETTKEYAEKGYINQGNASKKMEMTPDMFEQNQAQQYLYKTKNSMSLLQQFNKNSNIRMAFGGSTDSGNEENDEIAGNISNTKSEIPFTYSQAYGISANSENKLTAWEFIKFLSQEQQSSLNVRGLPVNINALADRTKQAITGQLYEPENNSGSQELTPEQTEIYDNYMAAIEEMSDKLNKYFIQDSTVNAAVNAEVEYFFNGSKTADEVAGVIQNKIELYLNE